MGLQRLLQCAWVPTLLALNLSYNKIGTAVGSQILSAFINEATNLTALTIAHCNLNLEIVTQGLAQSRGGSNKLKTLNIAFSTLNDLAAENLVFVFFSFFPFSFLQPPCLADFFFFFFPLMYRCKGPLLIDHNVPGVPHHCGLQVDCTWTENTVQAPANFPNAKPTDLRL